jgi:predicted metal-dependent TIM-barrel fold hydrolase
MTAAEDEAFAQQLELAAQNNLPVLVHTPHRDKAAGTRRSLDVIYEADLEPQRVLIDHLNEITVRAVHESGCWMAFSLYPDTKMSPPRMTKLLAEYGTERMLINSAADWGRSDPLMTAKMAEAMLEAGFDESDVDVVLWRNPVTFYGQSGRLNLDQLPGSATSGTTFAGNSVLRGERAG